MAAFDSRTRRLHRLLPRFDAPAISRDRGRDGGLLGALKEFTFQKKTSIDGEASLFDDSVFDASDDDESPEVLEESDAIVNDGSEGATLGNGASVEPELAPLSDDDFDTAPPAPEASAPPHCGP